LAASSFIRAMLAAVLAPFHLTGLLNARTGPFRGLPPASPPFWMIAEPHTPANLELILIKSSIADFVRRVA